MIEEPWRQEHLWDITNYALEGFRNMGAEIGNTSTPIIPLFIRDNFKTFSVTHDLLEEGIFVNPVVSPAVAPEDTLIRFSLMATHTKEQDDAVTRIRMELGSEDALTDHKGWQLRRYLDYAESEGGVCVLHLIADDPELFAGLDGAKISRVNSANRSFMQPWRSSTCTIPRPSTCFSRPSGRTRMTQLTTISGMKMPSDLFISGR